MSDVLEDWVIPFFSIWIVPRATIRRVINTDPDGPVMVIAWILGALVALTFHVAVNANILSFAAPDWLRDMGPAAMGMTVFSAGIAGIGMVYLYGSIDYWVGRLLGGTGDVTDVRSAVAWGWIPLVLLCLLTITSGVFTSSESSWQRTPTLIDRITPWSVAEVGIALWSMAVSIQTLAEVHRFSGARALGTKAIGAAIISFLGLGVFIVMTLAGLVVSLV